MCCGDNSRHRVYVRSEKAAHGELFSYIRNELFEKPLVKKLTDLTELLISNMKAAGIHSIKESTKKHIRRTLSAEFGDFLRFLTNKNGKVHVFCRNISLDHFVKENHKLKEGVRLLRSDRESIDTAVALHLRASIKDHQVNTSWPPLPSELQYGRSFIPGSLQIVPAVSTDR